MQCAQQVVSVKKEEDSVRYVIAGLKIMLKRR